MPSLYLAEMSNIMLSNGLFKINFILILRNNLDVLIKNFNTEHFETSVFKKQTYTGLLTNFLSFAPEIYKKSLVKTLINRIYHICSNWEVFNKNTSELKQTLDKNMFPSKLVDKTIKIYLDNKLNEGQIEDEITCDNNYIKLPYIGKHSELVSKKIKSLCQQFCKNTEIKVSFSMLKVGDLFSAKCRTPDYLKSGVVYHFICAAWNDSYVGMTTRHFNTRVHEHLYKVSCPTGIFKHLQNNSSCKQKCDESCFKIIDNARTTFSLKIKEALHTYWLKPKITKQKNLAITITI